MSMGEVDVAWADRLRVLLLDWGKNNIKSYPWRYINDPYCILVSEFMLHRTQTKQVVPIYMRFISRYPEFESFVYAEPSEINDSLMSLGLQWRIDGMIKALHEIWRTYNKIPIDVHKLIKIQGIGQYISGATVCFSQNIPVTLIDSNIVRVIGRVYGLDLSGEARRRKTVIDAIRVSVDQAEPRNFYYAIIDLSHEICRPVRPVCINCPLLEVPCTFGQRITV